MIFPQYTNVKYGGYKKHVNYLQSTIGQGRVYTIVKWCILLIFARFKLLNFNIYTS